MNALEVERCSIICLHCNKDFKVFPSRYDRTKFCSKECKTAFTVKHKINCKTCGKEFEIFKYQVGQSKFCSRKCFTRKITKNCENCRNEFQVAECLKSKKFCSKNCYISAQKNNSTSIVKLCVVCKKEFSVFLHLADKKTFCSRVCFDSSRAVIELQNGFTRKCSYCETDFSPKRKISKYCSKNCAYASFALKRKVEPNKVCEYCNKKFRACLSQPQRKFCSQDCRTKKCSSPVIECARCHQIFKSALKNAKYCSLNCRFPTPAADLKEKDCSKCKKTLPVGKFGKRSKAKNGLNSQCKKCDFDFRQSKPQEIKKAANRAYYLANKPKYFNDRQKRRARTRNAKGNHTFEQWQEKVKFWGNRCYLCRESLSGQDAHAEHRIPLSRGGSNFIANIAPACKKCNLTKHNKTEKEYQEWKKVCL